MCSCGVSQCRGITCLQSTRQLKGEDGGVLARSERVHKCLAHEQPDSDTDGDRNHRASNVDTTAARRDASRLRQAGL